MRVPVKTKDKLALMPTSPARARMLISMSEATPYFVKGIFCIRLNREPSARTVQSVAVGIDPGSKKEGFSVLCDHHTLLNLQIDAVCHVKDALETKRMMRRSRRNRNTPCRKPRFKTTRRVGWLPPSTRARWESKINVVKTLMKIYPITNIVCEDVSAKTRPGKRNWNKNFSPIEVGKNWFYGQLESLGLTVETKKGFETAELRKTLDLKKSKDKMSDKWDAHCVDSFVLATVALQQIPKIDESMMIVKPLQLHRRQLHALQPAKGGVRRPYGSTRSLGLRRGSIVKHPKYGICLVGGTSKGRISLNNIETGSRLCQNAKIESVHFLSFNNWNFKHCPTR